MLLDTIASPSDLRGLTARELTELAAEIRARIVEAVARTGGHLGPNLGVVELTIALHRRFDSPHDRIVWDTGHQAYVHKMLTGRADAFRSLRTAGGLAGYPSRAESVHDIVENSHASTALSWAAGLAWAERDRPAELRRHVVAVLGDGALTGGMAYEALNNIGHHRLPVIAVLNDNGRSYAATISRLARRSVTVGRHGHQEEAAPSSALQAFVASLGITYVGPLDGHDLAELEAALCRLRPDDGPVLLHVLTEKGKGYAPAEQDEEKRLHDTSRFDPTTGRSDQPSPRTFTAVFSEALLDLATQRPDVVAMTAAMPGSTGLLAFQEREPRRIMDVGIAEQHAVTAAAGLAHAGHVPILAVYSTFLSRAFDQLNLDVGLHSEHVVIVLDRAGITGDDGPSHHGILDLALALRIPGLTVLAPSCEEDLVALLHAAVDADGPVLLRFPKGAATSLRELGARPVGHPAGPFAARRLRDGSDVCVIAVGDRAFAALDAADQLAMHGIDAAVYDVRSVRPLDPAVIAAAARAPLVVTVENGVADGGAGNEILARLRAQVGPRAVPPAVHLGVPTAYIPHGAPGRILAELGLDGAGIAAAVMGALDIDARPSVPVSTRAR